MSFRLSPVAQSPRLPLARNHRAVLAQTGDHLVQGRMRLAVLDALDPEFIDGLHDFHVHGVIAGDAAGAAHLAVVDDVEEPIRIVEAVLQHRRANIHSATARVTVKVVPGNAGAHVGKLESTHPLHWHKLAGRAAAAHLHIALVLFQSHRGCLLIFPRSLGSSWLPQKHTLPGFITLFGSKTFLNVCRTATVAASRFRIVLALSP